jgi:pimeloyl-ACP methyl ester carboxylesterase
MLRRLLRVRGEAKLYSYGARYGTMLGMTFAQLYPERFGRFVVDAVMDLDDRKYPLHWQSKK